MIKERVKDTALRVCDTCGQEQWVNYWNIYRKDIHLCRYCNNNATAKTRKKYQRWNLGVKSHPKVEGNTYINTNGYSEVWLGTLRTQKPSGYYKEHRLLKEISLGRLLNKNELLHHVDGDKTNNKLKNLYICTSHKHHQNIHSQLERLSMDLVKLGIFKFDHEKGQYYIDPYACEGISKLGELLENPEEDNQQRSLSEMSEEERSTTIQKWSTLKRVEAPNNSLS